jgi:hypothetical protein
LKKVNQKIKENKKKALFEVPYSQILSENQLKLLKNTICRLHRIDFLSNLHPSREDSVYCGNGRKSAPFVDFTLLATQPDPMTSSDPLPSAPVVGVASFHVGIPSPMLNGLNLPAHPTAEKS